MMKLFVLFSVLICIFTLSQSQAPLPNWDQFNPDPINNGSLVTKILFVNTNRSLRGGSVGITQFLATMFVQASFDASAAYHPTAKGYFTNIDPIRRPVEEHTEENRNIAQAFGLVGLLCDVGLLTCEINAATLAEYGYDVFGEYSLDTPMGIGKYAASKVADYIRNCEMNVDGRHPASLYPGAPYSDTTGYTPKNHANELVYINSYQPGVYRVPQTNKFYEQIFDTPQLGDMDTFGENVYDIPCDGVNTLFNDKIPKYHWKNLPFFMKLYQVIQTQKDLTTYQKLVSELWDDKFFGPPTLTRYVSLAKSIQEGYGQVIASEPYVQATLLVNMAGLDAMKYSWHQKRKFDHVRPFSVIRHFFNGTTIHGWAGPGQGIQPIDGSQWQSYIPTDAHPEHPSGSSCLCFAMAEAARQYLGTDQLAYPFIVKFPPGSSYIEPGVTPEEEVVVGGPGYTLTQMAEECAASRLWNGVHFQESIDAARGPCTEIGQRAYETFVKLIDGTFDSPYY